MLQNNSLTRLLEGAFHKVSAKQGRVRFTLTAHRFAISMRM